jgi:hypothetical protein
MSLAEIPNDLTPLLDRWIGPGWTIEPLFGDASVRAYYRVRSASRGPFVVAWYPEAVRASLPRFVRAHAALAGCAPVPRVHETSDAAILQEDAGDRTLFDRLHEDRDAAVPLYERAIDLLPGLHRANIVSDPINPPFTAGFFENELDLTLDFFVRRHARIEELDRLERLERAFARVAHAVSIHPYVVCHRDYHGQNLHIVNDDLLMIDYQDMRMGPDTYDVASLLRDRGAADILGTETEMALVDRYAAAIGADRRLRQRYFETLLQRSIKILGTFAKQALVRGRLHYLDFIPPALASVRVCIAQLPEFAELESDFPLRIR